MRRLATFALAAGIAALSTGQAFATLWLLPSSDHESRFCDDAYILESVQHGFRHAIQNVPNLPTVAIVAFHGIQERRYEPFGDDRPIARRYCSATAEMNDGGLHKVLYLIEDGAGFVGLGDDVAWCISSFDRWNVYNNNCRVVR